MASSIYGVNGISSLYGVNSIYGVNSYRNYLAGLVYNKNNALSSVLTSAVASSVSSTSASSSTQSTNSYLTQLNNSINSMYMANTATALSSKKVASTNSNAITATAQMNASVKNYTVKVSQLATSQVNSGNELAAKSKTSIEAGFNAIKISSGATTRNVYFTINENDTNKSALDKIATAVNKSGAGVKASVETGKDDSVYLKLEASKSGSKNAFSVTDLQGNAVAASGIEAADTKAQNAVYTVDGRQYASSGNTVSLDNGKVQATLKAAGNTETELSVVPDTTSSKLPDFYSYLNNMLSSGNYSNSGFGYGALLDMFL